MSQQDEKKLLRILRESYVLDMYAARGPRLADSAFHPQFQILIPAFDGRTGRITDVGWMRPDPAARSEPKGAAPERTFEVAVLDITGKVAVCKVQVFRQRRLEYTDLVTFVRIGQDWRIVAKAFHRHASGAR